MRFNARHATATSGGNSLNTAAVMLNMPFITLYTR
jgi:hypothetical protein